MIVASEATPGEAVPAHREDLLDSPAGERAWRTAGSGGSDPGRPACPSSRKRRSHLYTVARETPTPSAVCVGVQPNSTTRVTTSSLPSGVSFAPGWDVRVSVSMWGPVSFRWLDPNADRRGRIGGAVALGCSDPHSDRPWCHSLDLSVIRGHRPEALGLSQRS